MAIGKRATLFVSTIPQEQFNRDADSVSGQLADHFKQRAECYVVESVGTATRAVEVIAEYVETHGVKFVVVDYAQLLKGEGRGRYEQTTNTSIALRQVASATKIVLVVLCQLNRAIESRPGKFAPTMADIKDTGQFEQDADVIIFQCWPHRLDSDKPANEYQFFIAKNRNREINERVVTCRFEPSRQMFTHTKAFSSQPGRERHEPRGMDSPEYDFK